MILAAILAIVAAFCYIMGIFSFINKGFLFNNVYIYASKEQRAEIDKKPLYRQTGIIFFIIGTVFLIDAVEAYFKIGWLFIPAFALCIAAFVYAVVSTALINKKYNRKDDNK